MESVVQYVLFAGSIILGFVNFMRFFDLADKYTVLKRFLPEIYFKYKVYLVSKHESSNGTVVERKTHYNPLWGIETYFHHLLAIPAALAFGFVGINHLTESDEFSFWIWAYLLPAIAYFRYVGILNNRLKNVKRFKVVGNIDPKLFVNIKFLSEEHRFIVEQFRRNNKITMERPYQLLTDKSELLVPKVTF